MGAAAALRRAQKRIKDKAAAVKRAAVAGIAKAKALAAAARRRAKAAAAAAKRKAVEAARRGPQVVVVTVVVGAALHCALMAHRTDLQTVNLDGISRRNYESP